MDYEPKMLFGSLHYADRCGAKTRNGGRCQNMPMVLGGRCRMHGGNSLRGPEHPRYKEGKYSKYKPFDQADLEKLIAQLTAEPVVLDLPDLLADLVIDFDLADVAES